MKVKKLIELLKNCNPEAFVIAYSRYSECDTQVVEVENIENVQEKDIHYCQADSLVRETFLNENIVYLIGKAYTDKHE